MVIGTWKETSLEGSQVSFQHLKLLRKDIPAENSLKQNVKTVQTVHLNTAVIYDRFSRGNKTMSSFVRINFAVSNQC